MRQFMRVEFHSSFTLMRNGKLTVEQTYNSRVRKKKALKIILFSLTIMIALERFIIEVLYNESGTIRP